MQSKLIKMNIFLSESSQIRVETIKAHGNPRNHILFERAQLSDAFEFANFEICYRYVLPELRSFSGSIGPGNRRTRLEIAGEVAFDSAFGRTGDVHRPTVVPLQPGS